MEREDIEKRADLSRLSLAEDEIEQYQQELGDILEYVSHIQDAGAEVPELTPADVHVANVFREDGEPHESGAYTSTLLDEVPDTKDGYIKVKKIL